MHLTWNIMCTSCLQLDHAEFASAKDFLALEVLTILYGVKPLSLCAYQCYAPTTQYDGV